MEMARYLFFEKRLAKKFWAKAMNSFVYLLNRLSTKALNYKTPYHMWLDKKLALENLEIFGSICYMRVPNIKWGTLDNKADFGILVGYNNNTKG